MALTLRLVCGLTTAEIAAAFLVPEATMAARVTRAKKKIAAARIPYRVPDAAQLPDRLDAVLTVVHLLYTTGHTAPAGDHLVRDDLAERALHLARTVAGLMPDEREARGLLALLLLSHARRATRTDAEGGLALLADADRSRWDQCAIAEGIALVVSALRGAGTGAVRAGSRCRPPSPPCTPRRPATPATDWPEILGLYDELLRAWPSPVVALNRAVALAEVAGPDAGLAEIAALEKRDARLAGYRYLPAARADLLRRAGRRAEAAAAYAEALALAGNEAERAFLARRLAALGEPG